MGGVMTIEFGRCLRPTGPVSWTIVNRETQVREFLMKSPFLGMDPYIEAFGLWGDFHSHLIEKIGEKLADAAPDRYLVRTGERSYIVLVESEGKKSYTFCPT